MSLRIALPQVSSRSVQSPADRLSGETGTPLYLGGVLMVALLAALVWVGLF